MPEQATKGRGAPPVAGDEVSPQDAARWRGRTYLATKPAIVQARRQLTHWLRSTGADELMVGDIAVAVSEACTNSVVHAYRDHPTAGGGPLPLFRVAARRLGEAVAITVADNGSGMQPRPDSPGAGLGLPLIATLSDHVDVRTGADGTGSVVAMQFTAAGAHGRTLGPRARARD